MIISNLSQNLSVRCLKKRSAQINIIPYLSRQYCNANDNYWVKSINKEEVEVKLKDKFTNIITII